MDEAEQTPNGRELLGSTDQALGASEPPARGRQKVWLAVVAVGVAAAAARALFLWPGLSTEKYSMLYVCVHQVPPGVRCLSGGAYVSLNMIPWAIEFVAIALPAVALVQLGFRKTFWVPFVAPVLVELTLVGVRHSIPSPFDYSPSYFKYFGAPPYHPGFWASSFLAWTVSSLVLMFCPAVALLLMRRTPPPRKAIPRHAVAAIACCAILSMLLLINVNGGPLNLVRSWDVFAVRIYEEVGVFILGAMLATRKPWWPWLPVLVPLLSWWGAAGVISYWICGSCGTPGPKFTFVHYDLPLVAYCFIASLWWPIAGAMDRFAREKPDRSLTHNDDY